MNKQTLLSLLAGLVLASGATGHAQKPNMRVEIHNPAKFDSDEDALDSNHGQEVASEHRPLLNLPTSSQSNNRPDGALQAGSGPLVNTIDGVSFDGVFLRWKGGVTGHLGCRWQHAWPGGTGLCLTNCWRIQI